MTLTQGTLHGDIVYLCNYSKDDIDTFIEWNNNIEFARHLMGTLPRFFAEKDTREWLDSSSSEHELRPFGIRLISTDELIGLCSIKDIVWQARTCKFWIGIGNKEVQGRGCGTDAVKIILRYAFMEMNMQRVGLDVGAFNARAIRAYEKAGFKLEGTTRRGQYREGQYWDIHHMGILREEWDALQNGDA